MNKGLFTLNAPDINFSQTFDKPLHNKDSMIIKDALRLVLKQLTILGRRPRTLHDYEKWTLNFCDVTESVYLEDITVEKIYQWLQSMNVSNSSRNIRLKSLKAVLSRFFDNGWLPSKFWQNIVIKVDVPVKPATTDKDIKLLLSVLDLRNWFELRDATAILLMYTTGIRLATLSKLKHNHISFNDKMLNLTPDIMKNHEPLKLPLGEDVILLLQHLISHNDVIRQKNRQNNSFVFITQNGTQVQSSFNNNVIQKRLGDYSKLLRLENISPHALRRGFATNLMKQDAPVALISKALGHKDLSTTTRYLYLDNEEVANKLKSYL